jgi:hypothetical protein
MASPSEDSEISTEGRVPGIQEAPDTPDVNINYTVEPEIFEEWSQVGCQRHLSRRWEQYSRVLTRQTLRSWAFIGTSAPREE